MFDAEWEFTVEEAKQSKDLAGVRELLQHWRHCAYQELREPGAYFRVLVVMPASSSVYRTGSRGCVRVRHAAGHCVEFNTMLEDS